MQPFPAKRHLVHRRSAKFFASTQLSSSSPKSLAGNGANSLSRALSDAGGLCMPRPVFERGATPNPRLVGQRQDTTIEPHCVGLFDQAFMQAPSGLQGADDGEDLTGDAAR